VSKDKQKNDDKRKNNNKNKKHSSNNNNSNKLHAHELTHAGAFLLLLLYLTEDCQENYTCGTHSLAFPHTVHPYGR